jgi:hypothetical protein
MEDDPLYDQTLEHVKTMFNDESVDQETAKERLQGLRDEIDILISTLD